MSAADRTFEVACDLARLAQSGALREREQEVAERSIRQLVDPLRMVIFGSNPDLAISILNLVLGKRVMPRALGNVPIQFNHSDEAFAEIQFQDGEAKRIPVSQLEDALGDNVTKIKIGSDRPVLKKVSIRVLPSLYPNAGLNEADKIISKSDFAIWLAGDLTPQLQDSWERASDQIKAHSYLIGQSASEIAKWGGLDQEFVEHLTVNAEAALTAKNQKGGADKQAFQAAGGMDFVRLIKSEIALLEKSALDTADVLLLRYSAVNKAEKLETNLDAPAETNAHTVPDEAPGSDFDAAPRGGRVSKRPLSSVTTRPRSVPSSKVAKGSGVISRPSPATRTPEPALQKRPLGSHLAPERKKKSRPPATPWSLGL